MIDHDVELNAVEREALMDWADPNVPDDFADRVISAWQVWNAADDPIPATSLSSETIDGVVPQGASTDQAPRWRMPTIAALAVLAAGIVTWIVLPGMPRSESPRKGSSLANAKGTPSLKSVNSAKLAEDATEAIVRHCSPCHTGFGSGDATDGTFVFVYPTIDAAADRDALVHAGSVVDGWWSNMSDMQLQGLRDRFLTLDAPTSSERRGVDAFVAAELLARR